MFANYFDLNVRVHYDAGDIMITDTQHLVSVLIGIKDHCTRHVFVRIRYIEQKLRYLVTPMYLVKYRILRLAIIKE